MNAYEARFAAVTSCTVRSNYAANTTLAMTGDLDIQNTSTAFPALVICGVDQDTDHVPTTSSVVKAYLAGSPANGDLKACATADGTSGTGSSCGGTAFASSGVMTLTGTGMSVWADPAKANWNRYLRVGLNVSSTIRSYAITY